MAQKNNARSVLAYWGWTQDGYVGGDAIKNPGYVVTNTDDGSDLRLSDYVINGVIAKMQKAKCKTTRILPWLMPDPQANGGFEIGTRKLGYLPWVFERYPGADDGDTGKSAFPRGLEIPAR